MNNLIRVDSSIKTITGKDQYEGEIIFNFKDFDKIKVNYICNDIELTIKSGILDFKFTENGKEFLLKGKVDEFYDKLSDRQKLLYFCLFGIIVELVGDFNFIISTKTFKDSDFSNGINKSGNIPMNQSHIEIIFKKDLN